MIAKHILCPEKVRKVPRQFSWLDHRLVRKGHISRCSHEALALYLFLVTVADEKGLSYYSDGKIEHLLNMDASMLSSARQALCRSELIAYQHPLYQVLALDEPVHKRSIQAKRRSSVSTETSVSIAEVLRQMAGGRP